MVEWAEENGIPLSEINVNILVAKGDEDLIGKAADNSSPGHREAVEQIIDSANQISDSEPKQFAEDALSSQDEIAAIGITAAQRIIAKSQRSIAAELKKNDLSRAQRRIEEVIRAARIDLGRVLTQTTLAAEITGAAESLALATLPASLTPGAVSQSAQGSAAFVPPDFPPFTLDSLLPDDWPRLRFPVVDDAVEVLRTSPVASGMDFRQTAQHVQDGAFAVTGDLADESVRNIRDLIQDQIEGGLDRQEFIQAAKTALSDGPGLSDARLDLIFGQNVATALSDASERSLEQPLVVDAFPYREIDATDDSRVRPTHFQLESTGLDGTAVYWVGDPAWQTFRGPWDFGCRCAWSPLTVEMAASRGVTEAKEWMDRAKALSEGTGQPFADFLAQTEPERHQRVPWPTLDGVRIEPSKGFRRSVQFDEEFESKHPRAEGGKFGEGGGGAKASAPGTSSTETERNAVADYTSDKFQPINAMLRGESDGTDELRGIAAGVDRFLAKQKPSPGVTFRRFSIPEGREEEFAAKLQKGEVFSDRAFLSTRSVADVSIRSAFDGNAAKNTVTMKVRGTSGVDVSGTSLNPGESEVLYPRGTEFVVVDFKTTESGGILVLLDEKPPSANTKQFAEETLTPKQLRRKNRKARRTAARRIKVTAIR
jgi:hypothetical protein